MRNSMRSVTAVAAAGILFAGWAGFAQVQDKTKDKSSATTKKGPEAAKPAGDAGKKPDASSKAAPAGAKDTKQSPAAKQTAAKADDADEATIRQSAEAFVTAYNAHDAKAVSELFALKAEFTDEDGNLIKGREAIEKEFAETFQENPESKIKVDIDSIRVLTPNIAVEEGNVRGQPVPGEKENVSSYIAVHVKVDGRWLIASVKDYEADSEDLTVNDHLQDLAWLVGEWIEESPDSVVHTVCKWHDNDNFLMQEFKVQIGGQIAMSGTMRIGWDAVRKQFKSWVFDSKGGHAEGIWLRDGDEWIVKAQGATATGEIASSTNVYRRIDDDTLAWRSFDRVVDGERQDDIDEFVVKRRPPLPAE
jgi:uncharacterized protein (TIGR02246 family)